ncbi:hypothetical protein FRC06_009887, partial [Ceratobasidium sp. 370]
MSDDTKVVSLSDEELTALKFIGPAAAPPVVDFIAAIKKIPEHFEWLTAFQLACFSAQAKYHPLSTPASPVSTTFSEPTLLSQMIETTATDEEFISPAERVYFYHGISDDPPPLLQ